MVQDGGQNLLTVINEVLDLSKLESGKMEFYPEELAIAEIIDEVINETQILFFNKGLTISREVAGNLPRIQLDRQSIRQVLMNFVSNACKFTERGGVVVRAFAQMHKGENHLTLEVEDTGCGISSANFQLVFEPFRQVESGSVRKHGGTGLGLCIAKRLVELQGGEIFLRSITGRGSVFGFNFPKIV